MLRHDLCFVWNKVLSWNWGGQDGLLGCLLKSYLSDIHNVSLDSILNEKPKTVLFIIQVDMCGSCTEEKKKYAAMGRKRILI
jgi:hypothetical protein